MSDPISDLVADIAYTAMANGEEFSDTQIHHFSGSIREIVATEDRMKFGGLIEACKFERRQAAEHACSKNCDWCKSMGFADNALVDAFLYHIGELKE